MKTPKQDMTVTNAVKNILGFAAIVLIVPPFFSVIYKISQPSESTQYINGAADRIQASMDRAKALQSQPAPEAKSDKASFYSRDLAQRIILYNTTNQMQIASINEYNADIDLMNAYDHLRTPERVNLANQTKADIGKITASLKEIKEDLEKRIALEGFPASLEPDQKVPAVKVLKPISKGAVKAVTPIEVVAPVEAEDPVAANILNHYQNPQ